MLMLPAWPQDGKSLIRWLRIILWAGALDNSYCSILPDQVQSPSSCLPCGWTSPGGKMWASKGFQGIQSISQMPAVMVRSFLVCNTAQLSRDAKRNMDCLVIVRNLGSLLLIPPVALKSHCPFALKFGFPSGMCPSCYNQATPWWSNLDS